MLEGKTIIQNQIEEIQRLNDEKNNRPLSLEELKQVFISMGNTTEDWNELIQKADEFNKLGDAHFSRNNHTEAFEAFESATKLNPYQKDAWGKMAKCQLELYHLSQEKKHIERIESYVNKALAINASDQHALNCSAELNRALQTEKKKTKSKRLNLIKIVLFMVVPTATYFIGFGGLDLFSKGSSSTTMSAEEKTMRNESDELAKIWTSIAFQINPISEALENIVVDSNWQKHEVDMLLAVKTLEPTVELNSYSPSLVKNTHDWYKEVFSFIVPEYDLFSEKELAYFKTKKAEIDKVGERYNKQVRVYERTRQKTESPSSYSEYPFYEFDINN